MLNDFGANVSALTNGEVEIQVLPAGAVVGVKETLESLDKGLIEAGFGWTKVDSNVADGPPQTGCWWDPWWGYICSNFYSTYSENLTSYSAALGMRWDFNNYSGIRAAYGILELDTSSNTENAQFDMWRVEYAWRF